MSHLDNVIQIEVGALCVGRIKNNELTQFERYDEKDTLNLVVQQ